ncbi:MAG: DUF4160 domain-containing protein [Candidatus Eisenbacteria bacterium]|nr:DUF4160 domain-containing protein [Candidatus Eisenbacteria bacterium]
MPVLSAFFGIVVRMYYREHAPAHFHAEYAGRHAAFGLDGDVIRGGLGSSRAERLVRLWALRHREELEANWLRALEGQPLRPIPPLE